MNKYIVYFNDGNAINIIASEAKRIDEGLQYLKFYDEDGRLIGEFKMTEIKGWEKVQVSCDGICDSCIHENMSPSLEPCFSCLLGTKSGFQNKTCEELGEK